jgi:hypothetical protein
MTIGTVVVIPEPSDTTHAEIGRLCMAWAVLEARSEATLRGILGADRKLVLGPRHRIQRHGRARPGHLSARAAACVV